MAARRITVFGWIVLLLMGLAPMPVGAEQAQGIRVTGAWSRPMPRSAQTAVIYMNIQNTGSSSVVVKGVRAEVSGRAEIHRTVRNGDVARMEPVGSLQISAGETVSLEPDGMHIMLADLQTQLIAGKKFAAQLQLGDGGSVSVVVEVLTRAPGTSPTHH